MTALTGSSCGGSSWISGAHISRVTSPCSWLTALTPAALRIASAVMLNSGAAAVVVAPECQEVLAVVAEPAPAARQVRLDHVERERVVTRRHGRVGREHGAAPHFGVRIGKRVALLEQLADALQDDERGVTFVEVPHRGVVAERAQDAHAADAEDDLLLHARFAIAAVQARRELAIPRRVLGQVGVHQVQRDATQLDVPHRHQHGAVAERHGDHQLRAVGGAGALRRGVLPVDRS